MRIKLKLTAASLKMYLRQREAIIWSVLLPLFIVFLFSFVKFDGIGRMHVGVVNEAGEKGTLLIEAIKGVKTFDVAEGNREAELKDLEKGERDIVVVIPRGFDPSNATVVQAYADVQAKPRESQIGSLVLQQVLDEMAFRQSPQTTHLVVKTEPVVTRNLTYIDFLIPGVLSMSIMQMGIFGVAFGFVSLKKRGILRRLWVTPIHPADFIIAQVTTRVIVMIAQVIVIIGVGMLFLNLHFAGSIFLLLCVAILGAVVFLGFGFALAGISKSEDQVAPLANIITLPMLLLSGVFFSRANLPGFMQTLTGFFPLTYLADGMRSVAIDGATVGQIGGDLLGLAVWGIVSCAVAVKMFRWE